MEISIAILSSSAEEMVMNIIKMSIQHISCARANEIVNIALCSYSLIGARYSSPHMYEKYSERVCIYIYIYIYVIDPTTVRTTSHNSITNTYNRSTDGPTYQSLVTTAIKV